MQDAGVLIIKRIQLLYELRFCRIDIAMNAAFNDTIRSLISGIFWSKSKIFRIPDGNRVYVIGDIHGQRELLSLLMTSILHDADRPHPIRCHLVFLGDYIDRGNNSADILKIFLESGSADNMIFLKGNHEQMLLDVCSGRIDAAMLWMKVGGQATLASFGVDLQKIDLTDPHEVIRCARTYIDESLRAWMEALPLFHRIGDYYFVHAGVRPGRALARQKAQDQLWIRTEFSRSKRNHGAMIVHGHTIYPDGPFIAPNRIGIDTGAYRTGRLTALALEQDRQWIVDVHEPQLASGVGPDTPVHSFDDRQGRSIIHEQRSTPP